MVCTYSTKASEGKRTQAITKCDVVWHAFVFCNAELWPIRLPEVFRLKSFCRYVHDTVFDTVLTGNLSPNFRMSLLHPFLRYSNTLTTELTNFSWTTTKFNMSQVVLCCVHNKFDTLTVVEFFYVTLH
jgi:hypothetical protein